MSKWNMISSNKEGMPPFHVNEDKICCTDVILFGTEYKTVHLGYCIRRESRDPLLECGQKVFLYKWHDQYGNIWEDVNKWAPLPEERDNYAESRAPA